MLDALGKIFRNQTVTDADIKRYTNSLIDGKSPEGFSPLTEEQLPAGPLATSDVSLVSIGDLEGINRIATGHTLQFGPGMTVIFGSNGAGKSGYCRVLKKACHSRGASPDILGNMLETASRSQKASIVYCARNTRKEAAWTPENGAEKELGNIFVFDTDTADHYLSSPAEACFTPFDPFGYIDAVTSSSMGKSMID